MDAGGPAVGFPPMSETRFSPQRDELIAERDHLTTQLEQLGRAPGTSDLDFDEGFADSGQVTAERGEVDALVGSLRETLGDIDNALEKIDTGTYGICERCGKPIGEDRLAAMPMARLCIQCASARR
jgi:RNA polymerase-binding transcription factor DksA